MPTVTKGRTVFFVFDAASASEVMRRRTTGGSIAARLQAVPPAWPAGAQAHIGNDVRAGDICPAVVVAVNGAPGSVNLKVHLDGADEYWATSVGYAARDEGAIGAPRTWHWPPSA